MLFNPIVVVLIQVPLRNRFNLFRCHIRVLSMLLFVAAIVMLGLRSLGCCLSILDLLVFNLMLFIILRLRRLILLMIIFIFVLFDNCLRFNISSSLTCLRLGRLLGEGSEEASVRVRQNVSCIDLHGLPDQLMFFFKGVWDIVECRGLDIIDGQHAEVRTLAIRVCILQVLGLQEGHYLHSRLTLTRYLWESHLSSMLT